MKKTFLSLPLVLAGLLPAGAGFGAEMTSDPAPVGKIQAAALLEMAGFPAQEAALQASALDRTELAEVAQSDPERKGGDAIIAVAVIAAIVVLVYILLDHMDHMHSR